MGCEDMLKPGLVSVIMPNYNTPEEYLRAAMESILGQTYSNFEFIIVDDGSTNNSSSVIESYKDDRVFLIKNEKNLGISTSLNIALAHATGEFVARMDADDISLPQRLEHQVLYMRDHPEVVVCGTWIRLFGDEETCEYKQRKYKTLERCNVLPDRQEMRIRFLFGNQTKIIHPTAMFRHSVMIEHGILYNEAYLGAEDFRMWIDCCRIGEFTNVPEILLEYRIHKLQVTNRCKALQIESVRRIIDEQLSWLGLKVPDELFDLHFGFLERNCPYDPHLYAWLRSIIRANNRKKVFDTKKMKAMLMSRWIEPVYYEMAHAKGFDRIKPLRYLPLSNYFELIQIRKRRRSKWRRIQNKDE